MKKVAVVIIFLAVAVFLGIGGKLYYDYAVNLPAGAGDEIISFTVAPGENPQDIAKKLYETGFIRSEALFRLYLWANSLAGSLQAGDYSLPRNLNLKELASRLQHGTLDQKMTFIEGWRREEMADEISNLNAEEFLRESEGFEGYLFPDTYSISPQTTAKDLVKAMRENFDAKIRPYTPLPPGGLSVKELTILASIVEREVKFAEDRPVVAGILLKRLSQGWPLQADATVQYALGLPWKKSLSAEDLKIDSPYNTYLNTGLPPSPICNPGLAALAAVLEAENTDFWYYVSDKDGRLHYAKTLDEHNANVLRFARED